MQLDAALQEVCGYLHDAASNPALRVRLQSLDLTYSVILRVIFEVLESAAQAEEGEEGEEGEVDAGDKKDGSPIRSRLAELLKAKQPLVPSVIEWSTVDVSVSRDA